MEVLCTASEEESTTIALDYFMSIGVDKLPDMRLSNWLKDQLRRREWTQADFTRELKKSNPKLSTGSVSRWMAGRQPDTRYCDLIADVLGADLDTILSLAGHRPADLTLDPNSPEARLLPLIRQVPWDERQLRMMEEQLRILIKGLRGDYVNDQSGF